MIRALIIAGGCLATALAVAPDGAMASYTANVQARTLHVTGDRASDKVALFSLATTLQVDVGQDGTVDFTFDRAAVDALEVDAGAGDDEVRLLPAGGSFPDATTVDGSNGADTLIGSPDDEVFLGGSGNDFVDGNIGADSARLGAGADRFQWDPGDGSDTVAGESGNDALDFNGSNIGEKIDVLPDGSRWRLTRDVAGIAMSLDDVEDLNLRTLGSADAVTIGDVAGTGLKTADVDLASFVGGGDGVADTVTALGTDARDRVAFSSPDPGKVLVAGVSTRLSVTGSDATLDSVGVQALGGDDTFTSGVGISGPAAVVADGGMGDDTTRFDGTAADDVIGIQRAATAPAAFALTGSRVEAGTEHLAVAGLDGDDQIVAGNGIGTLTELTLDGGDGDDRLAGGDGDDRLTGGDGADSVDGNIGRDEALLGSGDDRFQWDPGDGSDSVDGQAGSDGLDFNGSNVAETIEVLPSSGRTRLFRNVAAIAMDFDTIERLTIRALGSADSITVHDLTGTGIGSADLDLSATAGGADGASDAILVNGNNRPEAVQITRSGAEVLMAGLSTRVRILGSEAPADQLRVSTFGGDDDVTIAPDVFQLIGPTVDLGLGER